MAWSWSHTADGIAHVRANITRLDRDELEVVYAEWKATPGGHFHPWCRTHANDLDDRRYQRALCAARYLSRDELAERIFGWAQEQATCTNGGWEAWICPYGCACHMVGFGDDRMPSIEDVARALREAWAGHPEPPMGEDDPSVDVRLQVYPDGDWALHVGLSDYDQDHRGWWGASSMPGGDYWSDRAVRDTAQDLIDQCEEQAALDDCD